MNFKQDRAIYLQIADYITENILSGKWKEGDRIPSVRDLAVSIEVNPNTVAHTYNYLQDKGIIYNQRGIGYFIDNHAYANTQKLEKEAFFKEQLPSFFKNMMILNMSINEIEKMFDEYKARVLTHEDKTTRPPDQPGSAQKEKT